MSIYVLSHPAMLVFSVWKEGSRTDSVLFPKFYIYSSVENEPVWTWALAVVKITYFKMKID